MKSVRRQLARRPGAHAATARRHQRYFFLCHFCLFNLGQAPACWFSIAQPQREGDSRRRLS